MKTHSQPLFQPSDVQDALRIFCIHRKFQEDISQDFKATWTKSLIRHPWSRRPLLDQVSDSSSLVRLLIIELGTT